MSIKTCGNCRYYKPDKDSTNGGFGACGRIKTWSQYDRMDRVRMMDEDTGEERYADEKAATADGSGYYSALLCRTDFGCVLHENLSGG